MTIAVLYSQPNHFQQMTKGQVSGKFALKKQLRDTQRLLKRDTINATIRQEMERKLKAIQIALEDKKISEVERVMISKYRMVRFFESQKAFRKISQTEKALKCASGEEQSSVEQRLNRYKAELNYIMHFPKTEKYISLYPVCNDEKILQERERIIKEVNNAVARGVHEDAYTMISRKRQDVKNESHPIAAASAQFSSKKAIEVEPVDNGGSGGEDEESDDDVSSDSDAASSDEDSNGESDDDDDDNSDAEDESDEDDDDEEDSSEKGSENEEAGSDDDGSEAEEEKEEQDSKKRKVKASVAEPKKAKK